MATGWWAATFSTISMTMQKMSTTMPGVVVDYGAIAMTMKKMTTNVAGAGNWSVGFSTTMKKISTAITAKQTQTGAIAMSMKKISTAITAKQTQTGAIAMSMKKMTTAITATETRAAYDAVGAGVVISTSGTSTFSITAALGADIFAIVSWSSSTASISSVKAGSTAMTQVGATMYENNSNTNGGMALYRLAGAGTGSAVTISVTSTLAAGRILVNAVSATNVFNVSTVATAFGSTTAVSQTVTLTGALILQAFAGGGASASFGSLSGGTNRYNNNNGTAALAINTATATTTFAATESAAEAWCGMAININ